MKRPLACATLLLAILFVSGCMFDSDDRDEVKKGSVAGTITMIVTGEPVAGVKVYLVNTAAKVDTVDFTDNRAAFVDSAVTGADGRYAITGIATGEYGVVPIFGDTAAAYRFSLTQNSGPYGFAMNGEARTVDFIAEKSVYQGADTELIKLWVTINADIPYFIANVSYARRAYALTTPFFKDPVDCGAVSEFLIQEPVGHFDGTYSEDNMFRVVVEYQSDVDFTPRSRTFYVGYMLTTPHLESWWTYDIKTGKLTHTP